jgi:hypothetical protein
MDDKRLLDIFVMTLLTHGNYIGSSIQTIVGDSIAANCPSVSGELTGIEFVPGGVVFSGRGTPAQFAIGIVTGGSRITVTRDEVSFLDPNIGTITTITKVASHPCTIA